MNLFFPHKFSTYTILTFLKCLFWHRTTYEKFSFNNFTKIYFLYPLSTWRRSWQPTPVFKSGEFHGQSYRAGPVDGVAKSRTQLGDKYTHGSIK